MAEVGCDDGTNMDFSATKNAHEIQKILHVSKYVGHLVWVGME
jgi:hypothetical protein